MSYAGDITPEQAWTMLEEHSDAVLVDCRTDAEWRFVGTADISALGRDVVYVEWNRGDGTHNDGFVDDLIAGGVTPGDRPVIFLCRSGNRSIGAAEAATARGLLGLGAAEGGALTRVASKAAGQAFEGGIQAVGMAAGDAALRDEPITAEKLVAAGLMGGALGGLVGGSLEGASLAAGRAVEGGRRALGGLARAVELQRFFDRHRT